MSIRSANILNAGRVCLRHEQLKRMGNAYFDGFVKEGAPVDAEIARLSAADKEFYAIDLAYATGGGFGGSAQFIGSLTRLLFATEGEKRAALAAMREDD